MNEQIEQLKKLFRDMGEVIEINQKISAKKNEIIGSAKKEEDINKIKQDNPFKPLPFVSSYTKLLSSFRPRQDNIIVSICVVFTIIYIILGVALIGWSGFQIFAYFSQTSTPLFHTIIHAVSYEIVLIVAWLIGFAIITAAE